MPGRVSSKLELEVCEKYEAGVALSVIALDCGIGLATTHRILTRQGVDRKRSTGPHTKINIDEAFFASIDTPEKAYWLGFIAADGYVKRHSGGGLVLQIKLSRKDESHLNLFKTQILSEHRITRGFSTSNITGRTYQWSSLRIVRKSIVTDIWRHGVTANKSADLRLPGLPEPLLVHFIRGYFDGDGCWYKHRHQLSFNIRSSSEAFALDLQEVLISQCEASRTTIGLYNGAFILGYEGNKQCRRIFDYLYKEDQGPKLDRKYQFALKHLDPSNKSGLSMNDPEELYSGLSKIMSEATIP